MRILHRTKRGKQKFSYFVLIDYFISLEVNLLVCINISETGLLLTKIIITLISLKLCCFRLILEIIRDNVQWPVA